VFLDNRMTAMNTKKLILLFTIIVFTLHYIQPVHAEPTATIIPTHGTKDTSIFLKIRGTMDASMYLYWDDYVLETNFAQNIPTGSSSGAGFDYTFNIPSQKPYSDPGVHTISIEVTYSIFVEQPRLHKEGRTFTTTLEFEVEGVVIDYEQLYEDLSIEFELLSSEYDQLESAEQELRSRVSELETELETLSENLQSVTEIQTNYNDLLQDYAELTSSYSDLLESSGENSDSQAIPGFPIETLVFGVIIFFLFTFRESSNSF
jgi:hypothetical protein